ncbi:hypothetical protein LguiB_012463 [Lonicera macranthoides]
MYDPRTENNLYLGFIYTSFQERANFISHGNTARHAKDFGDLKLAQICGTIAADKKRHETAYTKIVVKLFEIDPDGTILSFADMMRKKNSMPAHLMYNGRDDNLFEHFLAVAQRLKFYELEFIDAGRQIIASSGDLHCLIGSLAWFVWQGRNKLVFENSYKCLKILIAEASGFIEAYDKVHGLISNAMSSYAQAWVALPQGWFKVNCDA